MNEIEDKILKAIKERKIYEGQLIKNYKEFCKLLNEPVLSGNAKKVQIKKWKRYIELKKNLNSQSYLVEEIYKYPKYKNPQFFIKKSLSETEMGGVYKIQIENYKNWGYTLVYIGSTIKFRKRFNAHRTENYSFSTGKLPNGEPLPSSSELLKEGGIFSILEIFGDFSKMDTEERKEKIQKLREEENRIIKEYSKKENIILINRVIDNEHIFTKNKTKSKNIQSKIHTEVHIFKNYEYNNKKYKFLLGSAKKELLQGITEVIENNPLYKLVNKLPEDKIAIQLPYTIKIGNDENAKEYTGTIEVKSRN